MQYRIWFKHTCIYFQGSTEQHTKSILIQYKGSERKLIAYRALLLNIDKMYTTWQKYAFERHSGITNPQRPDVIIQISSRETNIFFIFHLISLWLNSIFFYCYQVCAYLYRLRSTDGLSAEHQPEIGLKGNNYMYIHKIITKISHIVTIFTLI